MTQKLDELYRQKGEFMTQIEIAQAQLRTVNEAIVNEINKKGNKPNNNQDQGDTQFVSQINGNNAETKQTH